MFTNILFYHLLTWSLKFDGDFVVRIITSQWLQNMPPLLRSLELNFRMEATLIHTRLDVGNESLELRRLLYTPSNHSLQTRLIPYLHQTLSVFGRSPLELLSVT